MNVHVRCQRFEGVTGSVLDSIRRMTTGIKNPLARERSRGRGVACGRWPVLACMLALAQLVSAQQSEPRSEHTLPLVMSASSRTQQGFVRIINHSNRAGTVQVHAIDDSGRRFGPIALDLEAKATVHFNSADLESGNDAKGLSGGVGDGEGDWRVELSTTLDIEPLAYIRTPDGFLTSMHDLVVESGSMRHHVPFFNPGANTSKVSRLRLVNPADASAEVVLDGLDDRGRPPAGKVRLTLPPGGARTVSAQQLESGGSGLSGRFGDGAGKWQLFVSADRPIRVMNLLSSASGHLANLSTSTVKPDLAPANQAAFDALVVGKRAVRPTVSQDHYYTDFVSPGRLREVEGSDIWTGRYTYQKTGANRGTYEVIYDDGDRCTAILLFETPTTGAAASACDDGDTDAGSWRLVDIPASSSPDLIVQSPSVSNDSPSAGQSFTLRATVRNQGRGRSAATTLRWYRSSDATTSTSDNQVGTDAVSGLAASGTSSESISLTAPSSPGTYYYGACVDSVSGESNTTNNCSSAVSVTVSGGGGDGSCTAGLVVNPGESCTYQGYTFSVSPSGQGAIAFFRSGNSINIRNSNINGVIWNFRASRNSGSNSWTIHQVD